MKINKFITMIYGLLSNIKTTLHLVTESFLFVTFNGFWYQTDSTFLYSNLRLNKQEKRKRFMAINLLQFLKTIKHYTRFTYMKINHSKILNRSIKFWFQYKNTNMIIAFLERLQYSLNTFHFLTIPSHIHLNIPKAQELYPTKIKTMFFCLRFFRE